MLALGRAGEYRCGGGLGAGAAPADRADARGAPLRDWKARAVRRTFADWPGAIAWVEDGFPPEARAWAAARLAQGRRTWLVDVSETGLTEEITQYLLEWSAR